MDVACAVTIFAVMYEASNMDPIYDMPDQYIIRRFVFEFDFVNVIYISFDIVFLFKKYKIRRFNFHTNETKLDYLYGETFLHPDLPNQEMSYKSSMKSVHQRP